MYLVMNKEMLYVRPLDAPWMTYTIRSDIRKRKRFYRKAILTQSHSPAKVQKCNNISDQRTRQN
jgi:hypothetical protein